jgi:hypothetical protein
LKVIYLFFFFFIALVCADSFFFLHVPSVVRVHRRSFYKFLCSPTPFSVLFTLSSSFLFFSLLTDDTFYIESCVPPFTAVVFGALPNDARQGDRDRARKKREGGR